MYEQWMNLFAGDYRVTVDDSCTHTVDYGTCIWKICDALTFKLSSVTLKRAKHGFCYYCYVMITNVIYVLYS